MTADFEITWHGSVATVEPQTRAARAWVRDNVAPDVPRWVRGAVAIDASGFDRLAACIAQDGLTYAERY